MKFKKNMKDSERIVRVILAVILIFLGTFLPLVYKIIFYIIAIIIGLSAVTGFCWIYNLLGLNRNLGTKK